MNGSWGWRRLVAVAFVFVLGAVEAWAAEACAIWRFGQNTSGLPLLIEGTHTCIGSATSPNAGDCLAVLHSIVKPDICISDGAGGCLPYSGSGFYMQGSNWRWYYDFAPANRNGSMTKVEETACPLDPCADYAGVKTVLSSQTGSSLPTTACHAVAGTLCQFKLAGVGVVLPGVGGWSATMEVTGESCSLSDDLGPMGECIVMEGGAYACVDRSSKDSTANSSCGEVNGQPVCLDDVPEGACALLADGGLVCAASEEPRTDGEGNPVTADVTLGFGGGDGDVEEFDYYGPGAAGNVIAGGSVSVVSSPGSVSGIPRPGVADGLPGPDGEGPGGEGERDAWDAGEGMAGVISALSSNSWLGVLSSAASALSGSASCPSVMLDFELLGEPLDIFQAACGYMEPYYGMWVAMMQIGWGLLALRIFWKGVRE